MGTARAPTGFFSECFTERFTLQEVLQVVTLREEWEQPTGVCRRKRTSDFSTARRSHPTLYQQQQPLLHRSVPPWRTMLGAE